MHIVVSLIFSVDALICSQGLEEDFKVWKSGFVSEMFPVLSGARVFSSYVTAPVKDHAPSPCECGKRSVEECCKTKSTKSEEVRG